MQAVDLAKKDKLYKDAIETAATSQDPTIVDDLLKYFVEGSEKECFAATLFMCYDFVHPDLVMELAWRNGIMDFAMPYFVQVLGEFKQMKIQMLEARARYHSAPSEREIHSVGPESGSGSGPL